MILEDFLKEQVNTGYKLTLFITAFSVRNQYNFWNIIFFGKIVGGKRKRQTFFLQTINTTPSLSTP